MKVQMSGTCMGYEVGLAATTAAQWAAPLAKLAGRLKAAASGAVAPSFLAKHYNTQCPSVVGYAAMMRDSPASAEHVHRMSRQHTLKMPCLLKRLRDIVCEARSTLWSAALRVFPQVQRAAGLLARARSESGALASMAMGALPTDATSPRSTSLPNPPRKPRLSWTGQTARRRYQQRR